MSNWLLLCLLLLPLTQVTLPADQCMEESPVTPPPAQARYDHTRLYHVELATKEHLQLLKAVEVNSALDIMMGHARSIGQNLTIMVPAHKVADFDDLLHTYNVSHRILEYNLQRLIDANLAEVQPVSTPPSQFDWQHYFHLDSIYAWLAHLAAEKPQLVTLLDIGSSTEGLPLKGVRIAHASGANKTSVFIESGIHAREWISPATATYIINELLYSSDPAVQALAREYNWLIFPCVNPDGYRYSITSDRMWRKNRALFGICRGVDLNRNYPLHWNTTGTSGDPCHIEYSGPAPGSELETQSLMQFVSERLETERIRTYIALHSFSQLIMFPYGATMERVHNYEDLQEISQQAAERIKQLSGRLYKSGSVYESVYPASGSSNDWAHGMLKIPITFTFELRGPPDSEAMFLLPAREIEPAASEAFAAIQTIVQLAAQRSYYN